jgi:hypothetical protein
MTAIRRRSLDEELVGLQLAFFEIIWDVFPWIKSVWIKENKGEFQVFVETRAAQDDKEWDDFNYLAEEVFNAGEKHKIRHTILHGPDVPKDAGYRELMSDRLFRKITKRHAPWRLENGQ